MLSFFRPFGSLLKGWLISFICWGFVGFAIGAQFVARTGEPWSRAIVPGIRDWLPWALLSPLLFRLTSRLPLDRQQWRSAVPIHLVVAVIVLGLGQWWKQELMSMERPGPGGPRFDLGPGGPPWGDGGLHREDFRQPPAPPDHPDDFPGPPHEFDPGHPHGDRRPPGFGHGHRFDLLRFVSFELPIYLMIMSGAHATLFYRRSQERAASLARARLEGLRSQLQPHFLFNTLNTIAGLVHGSPDRADAMLVSLSDLLRMSLESSNELEIPLGRELQFVRRYLELMHARHEERLRYEIVCEPELESALVPGLILQPLVENAVQHGLQPRPEGGLVRIEAERAGALLHLRVSDNGVGLSPSTPERQGIGLANTRARLDEMYGAAGKLTLRNGGGLIAEICIPYHKA